MIKTALYNHHEKLSAKIVPYAGYAMPVSYPNGINSEYFSVRDSIGMFDVSHMGEFYISGDNAEEFLQRITINDVSKLDLFEIQYTAMCLDNGGIIDDLLLYKLQDKFMMVVNASNIKKDYDWIRQHSTPDIKIENVSDQISLIALQGPKSREIATKLFNQNINMVFYTFIEIKYNGEDIILSRTGYTGELGYEIYAKHSAIIDIWTDLIKLGVAPCGLAVRDVLRMEMKYCLYGNDINEETNPIEAGLGWITFLGKDNLIGKDSIVSYKDHIDKKLISFIMLDRGIPRKGYSIYSNGDKIGEVTSGTQSPKLKSGIGLGYVDLKYSKIGTQIDIIIRDKPIKAEVVKPPFINGTSLLK